MLVQSESHKTLTPAQNMKDEKKLYFTSYEGLGFIFGYHLIIKLSSLKLVEISNVMKTLGLFSFLVF